MAYNLIKHFLCEETRRKIIVLGSKATFLFIPGGTKQSLSVYSHGVSSVRLQAGQHLDRKIIMLFITKLKEQLRPVLLVLWVFGYKLMNI